jgi:hypothetical protein
MTVHPEFHEIVPKALRKHLRWDERHDRVAEESHGRVWSQVAGAPRTNSAIEFHTGGIRSAETRRPGGAMTDQTIQPIETLYRGHRFRSRLEARWAVFFDAARIEWQYEAEGFAINGIRYLPDFWLSRLKCFAEIKPNDESRIQAEPLLQALSKASGHPAILLIGQPGDRTLMPWIMKEDSRGYVSWRQCIFCGRIGLSNLPCLKCPDHVYVAGSAVIDEIDVIDDDDGKRQEIEVQVEASWRAEILGACGLNVGDTINGGFSYGGPTIVDGHGCAVDNLADDCIEEVGNSDALFAWIDGPNTIGTIAEIGAAFAYGKPIFVAFATGDLAEQFYFAKQLATIAIVVNTPSTAWKLSQQWHQNIQ